MKQFRVVLIGGQAQGKTSIYNKITKSNEEVKYNGESCTRQVKQGWTSFGNVGFEVIDTPGFNSSVGKLMHAAGILAALTFGKVDRILLIVRYDRDDFIIRDVEMVFRPIRRYRQLITIIVTHMDKCENENLNQERKRISDLLQQKFDIESIIFYSNENNSQQYICQEIEKILHNQKKEQIIEILDSEIYQYFDLLELRGDSTNLMITHIDDVVNQFRKISKVYKLFIGSLENNENLLNILHEIILKIKQEANDQVLEFEKTKGEEILQIIETSGLKIQYLHYIILKKEIQEYVNSVVETAFQRMKKSNYHFYNYLKKCPFCGQIWLKVIGCNGATTCGSKVGVKNDDFLKFQPIRKIEITRSGNNALNYKIIDDSQINQATYKDLIIEKLQTDKDIKKISLTNNQLSHILEKTFGDDYQKSLIPYILSGNQDLIKKKIMQSVIKMGKISQKNTQKNFIYRFLQKFRANTQEELIIEKEILPELSFQQLNQNIIQGQQVNNEQKMTGCGRKIIWSELPPLDREDIERLFSNDLFDYFADQYQLIQEESQQLDKSFKELIKQGIQQQQQLLIIKNQNQEQQE